MPSIFEKIRSYAEALSKLPESVIETIRNNSFTLPKSTRKAVKHARPPTEEDTQTTPHKKTRNETSAHSSD